MKDLKSLDACLNPKDKEAKRLIVKMNFELNQVMSIIGLDLDKAHNNITIPTSSDQLDKLDKLDISAITEAVGERLAAGFQGLSNLFKPSQDSPQQQQELEELDCNKAP